MGAGIVGQTRWRVECGVTGWKAGPTARPLGAQPNSENESRGRECRMANRV